MFLYERTTERLAKQKRISYYFMESGFGWEDAVVGCSVVRGVRGAITVSQNSKEEILQATKNS